MKFLVFALLVAAVAAEEAARPERSAVWGVPSVVGVQRVVGVPTVVGPTVVSSVPSPLWAPHVRLIRSVPEEPARPERSAVWGVPSVYGVQSVVVGPRVAGPAVVGVPRLVAGPQLIVPSLAGIHG